MLKKALLALLFVASCAGAARALPGDVYYLTVAAGDSVMTTVPNGFQGIRVWSRSVHGSGWIYLRAFASVQRGWGAGMSWTRSPQTYVGHPLFRSGPWGAPLGRWNEFPYLAGDAFTIHNLSSAPDTLWAEVIR